MKLFKFMHRGSALAVLFVGALLLNIQPAHAVADLNITVTDAGQPLGGATITLTFPNGSTQTARDDDNDGVIAIPLGSAGRYRMTITTADGRSETTSFTAPSDGSVTVGYDASTGRALVSVNDTSRSASNGSPFSGGLYGTFGFTDWEGQFDNGSGSFSNGNTENMRKYGFGGELRYTFPNNPLFLSNRFFYHARGRSKNPAQAGGGFDILMRERWKNQMLLGWTPHSNDNFMFNLLVGITLARIQMEITSNGIFQAREKEVQVVPTFGAEMEWSINNARTMFFVIGATASIMNSITHNVGGGSQFIRADNDLQWDMHSGLRFSF